MKAPIYQQALKKAKEELDQCLKQRREIDQKIEQLKGTIEALSTLCGEVDYAMSPVPNDLEAPKGFGITMTIRQCLSESSVPLSAVQLRDALVNKGINMDEYANQMSVIHNTIKRLIEQGEVMEVRSANGPVIGYSLYPGSLVQAGTRRG